MSDAHLPPDVGDGESDPSEKLDTRRRPLGGDRVTPHDAADPGVDVDRATIDGASNSPAPDAGVVAAPSEPESGEFQPMLDLRLPETPVPPAGETPAADAFDPRAPSDEDRGSIIFDPPQHIDPGDTTAAADARPEISPIFSALDAAEKAAEAAPHRETTPEIYAFHAPILLPSAQLMVRYDEADATAAPLPASEPPASDPPEGDAKADAVSADETATPAEMPAQDAATPSPSQEQSLPPEALQDAAARIAAEATATAAALENLKRLLAFKSEIPAHPPEDSLERSEPPPIPAYRPAVQLPVTPPPMIAAPLASESLSHFEDEDAPPRRRSGAAVGSFLAGFALSWVFGAVLYVYLISG